MNVEEIVKEIKSGLTGIGTFDIEYLLSMAKKYQAHEKGLLILKEIIVLLAEYISEKDNIINNSFSNQEIEVMLKMLDAEEKIQEGNFEKAIDILEQEIFLLNEKYIDTDNFEWHSFETPIQQVLFELLFKPNKEIKVCNINFSNIYSIYAETLLKLGHVSKAMEAFDQSLSLNPLNIDTLISKIKLLWSIGKKEEAKTLLYSGFKIAHTPEALAALYKIYGDMNKNRTAYYSYYLTSIYDENDQSVIEKMEEIQKNRKIKLKNLTIDELEEEFEGRLPIGPDDQIIDILKTLAKLYDENGEYDLAIYYYDYLYNLIGDEKILVTMDSIYNLYLEDKIEVDPFHTMS